MQAILVQEGVNMDYTPVGAVAAGAVVEIGNVPFIANIDIPAGRMGALATEQFFDIVKDTSTFTAGDAVYWDNDGSPVGGVASSGACISSATSANLIGLCIKSAATGDTRVRVKLTAASRTATLSGSIVADDITGNDSTLSVTGKAGAANTVGGTATLAGGAGGATNAAGGASSVTGGAGVGTGAGGAASAVGGAGGATGAGGAIAITGGAGGSSSGTGGAVVVAGGAGSGGNANGGALTIRGGAKNGSGANGAIAIGDSNTASLTLGVMPRIPTGTVAAAGTLQSDAAAIVEGFTLVTGSTNAGVKLPSAVAGMQVEIKNNVAGNMKVWPNTSDAINAIAADAAFTMATLTCCRFVAYDATTWYTDPLVAS